MLLGGYTALMYPQRFPFSFLLLCMMVCLWGCDSSGWTNPPGDDDTVGDDDDDTVGDDDTVDDDDTSADDDDSAGDDDDTSAGDDDDSAGDDDDSAGDDDDSAGDDDDSAGDDDDSTPNPADADGDGYDSIASGGADCDDTSSAVYPGAVEDPTNSIDDDCDTVTDENMVATSFSPTDGLALGGTIVTVTGTGMTGVTSASFGAAPAANINVLDDTSVEIVSPVGSVGDVDLVISSSFDTVTFEAANQAGYRYTGECADASTCLDSAVLPSLVQITTTPGVASASFDVVLTEAGVTGASTAAAGILAEIGLGNQSASPAPNVDPNWQWFAATYAGGAGAGDGYTGTITHPSYGSFWVTFRFSDDGGLNWLYADSDPATPLDYLEMSQLHVTP
jgi:hypothetical protein